MLAHEKRMDFEITKISLPQLGAERHANEAKMDNANDDISLDWNQLLKD